jgi:hypothetical protein
MATQICNRQGTSLVETLDSSVKVPPSETLDMRGVSLCPSGPFRQQQGSGNTIVRP